jgi:MFS transporter, MCT family, solute carrier family 16 (monocarboxylic acid transporters), member 10
MDRIGTGVKKHAAPLLSIDNLQYSLTFALGIVWGRLFDIGIFHVSMGFSSVLLVLVTFLTGQCKEYWQLFLCQGVAIGISCSGVFGAVPAILTHWCELIQCCHLNPEG